MAKFFHSKNIFAILFFLIFSNLSLAENYLSDVKKSIHREKISPSDFQEMHHLAQSLIDTFLNQQ